MTPGTVVLLHGPLDRAAVWADLPELLRSYGLDVIAPDIRSGEGMQYVARAALVVAATDPSPPLLLVGHGTAGPLLPALAVAQRAAHRPVGGYLFLDAGLPVSRQAGTHAHDTPTVPVPADWPDAPCGYLQISEVHRQDARVAELRGWPVVRPDRDLVEAVLQLIESL